MARYSSDSDSDRSRHRRKNYRRSRSSSSESSDSSSYKRKSSKHSKSKRRHRSRTRSRDRSSRSYKYSRDNSRDKERRRQKSRRSRSPAANQKKQRRSASREKSTSRSSSSQSIAKPIVPEKVQNVTKVSDDFTIAPNIKESILDEINSDGFAPKQFSSSAQNKETKSKNIVIDITADTIVVPPITTIIQSDSIFHQSIIGDQEAKFDKWVKKLFSIRQKAQFEVV